MGMSHGNQQTFPRLADIIGFLPPEHLEAVAKAVITVHRDFGDRTNRKHARLKYVLEERGVDWFRIEVEQRAGLKLARPAPSTSPNKGLARLAPADQRQLFPGPVCRNGRIHDVNGYQLKTALRRVIERFQPEVRLTASQNLLLVNVPPSEKSAIEQLLSEHGVRRTTLLAGRVLLQCPVLPCLPAVWPWPNPSGHCRVC